MRIALIGQQDFGKAVLEAFLARGDTVPGVFCAPEQAGARPDQLRAAAQERGIPVHQFRTLRSEEARTAIASLDCDLGVMAYVLQFVPREFTGVPRMGTIQYHPSLLPRYRGPSSINWPIIRGDTETGLSIFRPVDALDEGPVLLQKKVAIGPDDTVASLYFDHLFPLGVRALLETADLLQAGKAVEQMQDDNLASYEGWCHEAEARINWHVHADITYNLIRGCNPAPGAWTTFGGKSLQIFDARKHPVRHFAQVRGQPGACVAIGGEGMHVVAQGGEIEILRVRPQGGKKMSAAQFCAESGCKPGSILGT
jgi:methionyl-tRNA formyltransferase